jgi:hypothetical protein
MLCYVMLCYAVLCYVMLCYAVLSHTHPAQIVVDLYNSADPYTYYRSIGGTFGLRPNELRMIGGTCIGVGQSAQLNSSPHVWVCVLVRGLLVLYCCCGFPR